MTEEFNLTIDELEPKKEMRLRPKQQVMIPRYDKLISEFAEEVAMNLNHENTLFLRPEINEVVEIVNVDGSEIFNIIKPNRFITHLEKFMEPVAEYMNGKTGERFYKKKSISGDLANTIIQSEQFQSRLPKIKKIYNFQIPILFANTLQFPQRGYDRRFKSWLSDSAPGISNPEMELKEAKEIVELIFKEFCFKTEQDKTNAIAMLLTPFLRGLFNKANTRVPLFIAEANRERSGKDFLVGVVQTLYDGYSSEEPPISTGEKGSNQNEELRKKIVSSLIAGKRSLHFANNKGYLNNSVLESLITTPYYTDRILGKNELVTFSNELDLSLSGNSGMTYTADIANRSRFIRLFLDIENANERRFENPNLHKWVFENRERILSALYSFVRIWFEKEKLKSSLPFASFPEWADVCGGIMECAGYNSPCELDKEGFAVGGDIETYEMKRLFEICYETCPEEWINKQKIKSIISNSEEEIFSYFDFEKKSDQTKFGTKLNKYLGRILSDIRLILQDSKVRSQRQVFKFSKEVGHHGYLGHYLSPVEVNIKKGIQRVTGALSVQGDTFELCESCSKQTSEKINGIPICEDCQLQVPDFLKEGKKNPSQSIFSPNNYHIQGRLNLPSRSRAEMINPKIPFHDHLFLPPLKYSNEKNKRKN